MTLTGTSLGYGGTAFGQALAFVFTPAAPPAAFVLRSGIGYGATPYGAGAFGADLMASITPPTAGYFSSWLIFARRRGRR